MEKMDLCYIVFIEKNFVKSWSFEQTFKQILETRKYVAKFSATAK